MAWIPAGMASPSRIDSIGTTMDPHPPFPMEELLQKLQELKSAVNTGKDSL